MTTVLCAVVVWTTGLNDTTDAGLQPRGERQREMSNVITPAIPEIVGDYVLIYEPQPDIYTGKDTKHYKKARPTPTGNPTITHSSKGRTVVGIASASPDRMM
jgi:hypothetical protein